LNAGITRSDEDVEGGIDVGAIRRDGILDGPGKPTESRLQHRAVDRTPRELPGQIPQT
jgi:hypothetical protein